MKQFLTKISKYNSNKILLYSLFILGILNFLQAFFTELAHDEAYYWMYSRHLAWGYFDHPPVIAVLIKAGYYLFQNEFGVRFFPVLLGISTLGLLYKMTRYAKETTLVFVFLVSSVIISVTHLFGFLAIPDNPIVFFSALFLVVLKKYLEKDTWQYALLLGVVASLMLYSKYHAVLVLFFSILPNLHLFRRKTFYVIPVLIIVLLLPHLFWQIQNGFPTFEYHLVSRASAYTPLHTWNYLYSQFLVLGPFMTVSIIYHAVRYKAINQFEKTLKWVAYGFFVFFFLASFRGHIEAHWTAVGVIPLLALAYNGISKSENAKKWVVWLFFPSLLLVLFIRLALAFPILPPDANAVKEFHNWDKWGKEIKELANGREVVFTNSFQRPAKYAFYAGEMSHSENNLRYRKNQYDIWSFADSLANKEVIVFNAEHLKNKFQTVTNERYSYDTFPNFVSYRNFKIEHELKEIKLAPNGVFTLDVELINTDSTTYIKVPERLTTYLSAVFADAHTFYPIQHLKVLSEQDLNKYGEEKMRLTIKAPPFCGEFQCFIALHNNKSFPGYNSVPVMVTVK